MTRNKSPYTMPEQRRIIIAMMKEGKKQVEIARKLRVSRQAANIQIQKCINEVPEYNRVRNKLRHSIPQKYQKILSRLKEGYELEDIAKEMGLTKTKLLAIIYRYSKRPYEEAAPLPPREGIKVTEEDLKTNETPKQVAQRLGVSLATVYLAERRYKIRLNRNRKWTEKKLQEFSKLYDKGYTIEELAQHFKTTEGAIYGVKIRTKNNPTREILELLQHFNIHISIKNNYFIFNDKHFTNLKELLQEVLKYLSTKQDESSTNSTEIKKPSLVEKILQFFS